MNALHWYLLALLIWYFPCKISIAITMKILESDTLGFNLVSTAF